MSLSSCSSVSLLKYKLNYIPMVYYKDTKNKSKLMLKKYETPLQNENSKVDIATRNLISKYFKINYESASARSNKEHYFFFKCSKPEIYALDKYQNLPLLWRHMTIRHKQ